MNNQPTPELAGAKKFFVFDVESVGLHGDGYAYGYVVVDADGNELASGREAVDPADVNGTTDGREWLRDNCPSIAITKANISALRSQFVVDWVHWKVRGAVMVADCPWPVEARFLLACDMGFEGPYPLIDVGSVVLSAGGNPIGEFDRLQSELPKHDPLCDARQSARVLVEHLKLTDLTAKREREVEYGRAKRMATNICKLVGYACTVQQNSILGGEPFVVVDVDGIVIATGPNIDAVMHWAIYKIETGEDVPDQEQAVLNLPLPETKGA